MTKAVFLDIDGTLGIYNKEALAYNLKVINDIRKQGHKVFINTGRTSVFLPEQIEYEKNFDGAVLGNGSHVIINGKTVFSEFMDKEFLKKAFDVCLERNMRMSFEGDDNVIYYASKEVSGSDAWIRVNSAEEFSYYVKKHEYRKVTYKGKLDNSDFAEFTGKIEVEAMGTYDGKPAECGEIIIKGVGKDKGIEKVMQALNIKREDTVAIGDSMNDYHMIKFAGVGVAVGNAEEMLKEAADMVTDECDKCGVGKALEKIFQKNEKKC